MQERSADVSSHIAFLKAQLDDIVVVCTKIWFLQSYNNDSLESHNNYIKFTALCVLRTFVVLERRTTEGSRPF
jgi:hypothetical protein